MVRQRTRSDRSPELSGIIFSPRWPRFPRPAIHTMSRHRLGHNRPQRLDQHMRHQRNLIQRRRRTLLVHTCASLLLTTRVLSLLLWQRAAIRCPLTRSMTTVSVVRMTEVAAHADFQLSAVAARTSPAIGVIAAQTEAEGIAIAGTVPLLIVPAPILLSTLIAVAAETEVKFARDARSKIAATAVAAAQVAKTAAAAPAEIAVAARGREIALAARGRNMQAAYAGSEAAVTAPTMAQMVKSPVSIRAKATVKAHHEAEASMMASSTTEKTMATAASVVAARVACLHTMRKAIAAAAIAAAAHTRSLCGPRRVHCSKVA